jgi:hypothetical protein
MQFIHHRAYYALSRFRYETFTPACLFPLGECKNGSACPFVHDKTKVAVCLKFLRGACDNADCPLSHTADQAKMPMCMYFVRGRCDKGAECVFAHVQVAPDAPVCQDFVKGVPSVLFACRNAILVSASSLLLVELLGAICVRFKAAVLALTLRYAEQTRRVCAADDW